MSCGGTNNEYFTKGHPRNIQTKSSVKWFCGVREYKYAPHMDLLRLYHVAVTI